MGHAYWSLADGHVFRAGSATLWCETVDAPEHPGLERLVDLAEGRLTIAEVAQTRTHLATCRRCADVAASTERAIQLMRTEAAAEAAEEPPEHFVRRAQRLLRQRGAAPKPSPRRWLAELRFDSAARLAPAGVRALASAGRQLVFSAGDYDLELRVAPVGDGRYELRGQLLAPWAATGRVVLTRAAEVLAEATLDELCEFTLPGLRAGDYSLRMELQDVMIEVSELEIRV